MTDRLVRKPPTPVLECPNSAEAETVAQRRYCGSAVALLVVTAVFSALAIDNTGRRFPDMGLHLDGAREMLASGSLTAPHFLFHALAGGLARCLDAALGGADHWLMAAVFVCTASQCLLALTFYWQLAKRAPSATPSVCAAISLGLLLVWPIPLLVLVERHVYFGYIGINVYHSPTMLVMRPLAALLFFQAVRLFHRREGDAPVQGWMLATLVLLSGLAKPSFLICFVPACATLAASLRAMGQRVDWKVLTVGLIVPMVALVSFQFFFTYSTGPTTGEHSSVVIAPLAALGANTSTDWLVPRWILSLLFPLSVLVAYRHRAFQDRQLQLAWLTVVIALALGCLLAESGPRSRDGNFLWSAQIACLLLFASSALFVLEQAYRDGRTGPALRCFIVFGLHVGAGILWWATQTFGPPSLVW